MYNFDKLQMLANLIESELSTPQFRERTIKKNGYEKSRYIYIWLAFNELNISRVEINKTLPCYGYGKTIYQVIRRMYLRRKNDELMYEIDKLKKKIK